jgi:hypothetical protein
MKKRFIQEVLKEFPLDLPLTSPLTVLVKGLAGVLFAPQVQKHIARAAIKACNVSECWRVVLILR